MATAPLFSQPPAVTPDADTLAALGRWQAGHRAHDITAADAAEAELLATRPTTPEGVAALLWVALAHLEPDAGDAPERGDLQWLEANGDRFDWGGRFIIAALRSLAAMPSASFDREDDAHLETLRLAAVLRAARERVHATFEWQPPREATNVVDDASLLLDMAVDRVEALARVFAE